jgi:hypothetical protein
VIRECYEADIFTEARTNKGVSSLKLSALYTLPFNQEAPLKNGFLVKIRIFRIDFLQTYATAQDLNFQSWKTQLRSTIS